MEWCCFSTDWFFENVWQRRYFTLPDHIYISYQSFHKCVFLFFVKRIYSSLMIYICTKTLKHGPVKSGFLPLGLGAIDLCYSWENWTWKIILYRVKEPRVMMYYYTRLFHRKFRQEIYVVNYFLWKDSSSTFQIGIIWPFCLLQYFFIIPTNLGW